MATPTFPQAPNPMPSIPPISHPSLHPAPCIPSPKLHPLQPIPCIASPESRPLHSTYVPHTASHPLKSPYIPCPASHTLHPSCIPSLPATCTLHSIPCSASPASPLYPIPCISPCTPPLYPIPCVLPASHPVTQGHGGRAEQGWGAVLMGSPGCTRCMSPCGFVSCTDKRFHFGSAAETSFSSFLSSPNPGCLLGISWGFEKVF